MNNRPIKILTLCGLLAILALQGIWLFTTYSTVRNETIKKSNELFKTAVTTELHIRMDNYTDEDGNDVYNTNIQIAECNALNATIAVIEWKKYFGIYESADVQCQNVYSIEMGEIVHEN